MTEQYTREIIVTSKYWFEEGWYTVKQLQELIDASKHMNKHLNKTMDEVSEHLKKSKHRNKVKK
jgi:activator of 2-hydroxyglutaryl-CoA dehydratase